jgi:hypothetical protein
MHLLAASKRYRAELEGVISAAGQLDGDALRRFFGGVEPNQDELYAQLQTMDFAKSLWQLCKPARAWTCRAPLLCFAPCTFPSAPCHDSTYLCRGHRLARPCGVP